MVERKSKRLDDLENGTIASVLARLKDGTGRIKEVAAGKSIKETTGQNIDKTFIILDLTQTVREIYKIIRESGKLNKEEEERVRHFYFLIR